ncbi:dihydroneopterin aldolase [Flammeovirga kamogawensis]|uniref:7,8-dihydroneopterin aldolase n=1 Tax=Flammeovirga kamogawensis TaxID=373891 RepID=A0ABX8GTT3_9BACT|nr:dihydroneopterin aldolase [Flammeovirga kamogawensis]MBB6459942.1 dihydroneopterin aldolase [Flammeovirga kamogawensis]QWG07005.1 dihydroneopterin aldolase [Flammeovirga kamogawensis]TRX68826.1 dihydroneopterin aldolase [Flammeovirga kamogawensis]
MKHTIALEGMEFFAYHGYFEEEQKIGNKYGVDLIVATNFEKAALTDDLEGTINYMELYEIVKQRMAISTKLLEHIGQNIVDDIYKKWENSTNEVSVTIKKFNPPIGGICTASSITIKQ